MDDLLERYLSAVCSYFLGKKRKHVYNDLKNNIMDISSQYDDMETQLVDYGHPLSVAYIYGYRPIIFHRFNKKNVKKIEKSLAIILSIYLFFSTLYYLQQFNCLPFFMSNHVFSTINSSSFLTWVLSHPIYILVNIIFIHILFLILLDFKYPIAQEQTLTWNISSLKKLPHKQRYPNHTIPTYLTIIFSTYFIIYTIIFSTPLIFELQNIVFQKIHLMTYFFQPFILMILFDYCIDMTKKIYTQRYLAHSFTINAFIFIALSLFVINSSSLKDYLLPFSIGFKYIFINSLIIIAVILIYIITTYKLTRDFITYKALYKK